jgi:PAS domain S-box-containing protein
MVVEAVSPSMKTPELNGLDEALARAADGAFAVDAEGRIVLWNRAAERIIGWSSREAIGRRCCDLFVGFDDRGNRLCYQGCHVMALVTRGDAVQSFDMKTRSKKGQPLWINVSTLTVSGAAGRAALTVHLFRDITATKELLTLVHERLAAPAGGDGAASLLTRRELEILRLIAAGTSTSAAADRLHVSPTTVRNHVQNILGKLGAHSRLEAVAMATRQRLL